MPVAIRRTFGFSLGRADTRACSASSYGYGKLSDLINATTLFEIERRSLGDGKQALMYAREKRRATGARKTGGTKAAKVQVPSS